MKNGSWNYPGSRIQKPFLGLVLLSNYIRYPDKSPFSTITIRGTIISIIPPLNLNFIIIDYIHICIHAFVIKNPIKNIIIS